MNGYAGAGVTLSAEIAGVGNNDLLAVTGDVNLGGFLDVSLLGYQPQLWDTFDVLVADGAINGVFDLYDLPQLDPGLTWDVLYILDPQGPDIVRLEVVEGNAPIAVADYYTVPHSNAQVQYSIDTLAEQLPALLDNDYDPDGDPLTAHVVDYPANGTLTWFDENTGHFVYESAVDFVGTDYFSYFANDGENDSYVTLVTIDVTNNAPTAGDDFYSTVHDTELVVSAPGVLSNDFEMDPGDVLQAVVLSLPANGTLTDGTGAPLTVGAAFDGGFQYTPSAQFTGVDYFSYAADDGYEQSVATVTIEVTNDIPIAAADSYSINHDTTLNVTAPGVLSNDFDMDPLQAYLVDDVSHGQLSFGLDGSFTYTPDFHYVGPDSFSYFVTDGIEGSNTAIVTIDVFNDIPMAGDDYYMIPMDTSLNDPAPGVMSNDFDMDPLEVYLISGTSSGSLSLGLDGSVSYTPNPGFTGIDSFVYYIADGIEDSNPATVTIDVYDDGMGGGGGGGMLSAEYDFYFTLIDTALNEAAPGVMWNDSAGFTTIAVLDANASNGFVTLEPDGSFVYTPNAGFSGMDAFTYHLEDGAEFSNVASVDIQVDNGEALLAAGPGGDGTFDPLQRAQLVAIVDQAVAQWDALIANPATRRAMREIDFRVADLPGNTLGLTFPTMIVIDVDAAGYGWFIDATPGGNEEFQFNRATGQYEATAGPAADRMDLLTVVLHELGHVAGFADETPRSTHPGDVMLGILDVGTRRLPDESHAFRFLSQKVDALMARLSDERPTDPSLLR